ncbi:MAG: RNA polymerase sporulation sigma factor SigK [Clostridia bacterium]|nr:RNA polymerase sporulation sigma factor SigK [Clostridia bacterium]
MLLSEAISQIFFLLSYISGKNSFPQPMSAEEERIAVEKMTNGDPKAREELIEKNLRLVAHISKKYQNASVDSDDLVSIGTIGLIKAVNTFKGDKGIRLATYAARCIENEILMVLRSSKKALNDVSIEEAIGTDKEGNEISLIDIISSDEDVEETVALKVQVDNLYKLIESELTEREKRVITMRFGLFNTKPFAQREVAKVLNISRSYVSRIEKKAISKLAEKLKEQ